MGKFLNISIMVIVFAVAVAVGFVVPTQLNGNAFNFQKNLSFSSDGLTFEYPSTYENCTSEDVISGAETWNYIFNVCDNSTGISISVQKNDNGPSPVAVKEADIISLKSTSGEVLSDVTTDINGIEMQKLIYKLKDPSSENDIKYINYIFKGNEGTTFCIEFSGSPNNFDKMTDLANNVMNSVKIQ